MASSSSSSTTQQRNNADSLILDELKKAIDMNCSVCFEVFTDPFLLTCGHTFCKKCTDSLIRCARENAQQRYHYGTPTIACPECRAEMPADGRSLVKNYRLADIINQFNLLHTDSKHGGATVRAANPPSSLPSRASIEILCNSCNEMSDPKHIFCCSWCSNARQEPFFACGTCCVTKHPQHPLTPYKQMTTPEEREIFVNNVMSVLRDASNSLQADFGESVRITPEYQNLKNVSFYFVGQFLIPFLEN
uniref:RING-type domain-containing protein n=1 Tax=Panagrolaimus davidi TaxID=227884 RepID=A0A914PAK6_9BILA